jgi:hypothetical protein
MRDNSQIADSVRLGKEELPKYVWQISVDTPEGETCDTNFCLNPSIPLNKDNDWQAVISGKDGAASWNAYVDTACLEAAVEGRKDFDRDDECLDFQDLYTQVNLLGRVSERPFHNEHRGFISFRDQERQARTVDDDTSTPEDAPPIAPSNK